MSLENFQRAVAAHDAEGWQHPPGGETDEHNLLHLVKTVGKIAAHREAVQDGTRPEGPIDSPTIADLVIEAIRFANSSGVNLEDAVETRLLGLAQRNRERDQTHLTPHPRAARQAG